MPERRNLVEQSNPLSSKRLEAHMLQALKAGEKGQSKSAISDEIAGVLRQLKAKSASADTAFFLGVTHIEDPNRGPTQRHTPTSSAVSCHFALAEVLQQLDEEGGDASRVKTDELGYKDAPDTKGLGSEKGMVHEEKKNAIVSKPGAGLSLKNKKIGHSKEGRKESIARRSKISVEAKAKTMAHRKQTKHQPNTSPSSRTEGHYVLNEDLRQALS
ncbi:hypothetical protein GN244_ATG13007 [Phytophthora infestans]|uniref:Uncharacterized protein n=1 Tax=Phytophthora infestans TaxID=4787 RepID=A0A833T7F6_PHYIN|nr:hypothetical protein GN244_ATG13007 [Phytophthora infestans]